MRDEDDVSKGTIALIADVFLVVPRALSVQEAGHTFLISQAPASAGPAD